MKKIKTLSMAFAASIAATATFAAPSSATAGTEPFIGEIMAVGFNFCPRGWARAEGQILPINQYQSLFSLYGTMYGGDGRTTFALPDLRGRAPVSQGTGAGLPTVRLGERGGGQTVAPTEGSARTQPYLSVQWCVALTGIFPSRN